MARDAASLITPSGPAASVGSRSPSRWAAWRSNSVQARWRNTSAEGASPAACSATPLTDASGIGTRLVLARGYVEAPAAHDLLRTEQVGHGGEAAPHVHQPTERKQQEDGHAEHDVHLVRPGDRDQAFRAADPECHHALRPVGQHQHDAAVRVRKRERQRNHAERQLHPEDDQDREVGAVAGEADARVEHAAVDEHAQTDEADEAGHAARVHRQLLLVGNADEGLVHPVRREQAHEMAEEKEQDADMEQVAAPAQRARAQHLRRVALPRVLVPVEARQAAHEEYDHADIRVGAEEEDVQIVLEGAHATAPGLAPARTRRTGCGWPGRAWPLAEQPSNAGGSAQASSSGSSAAGLAGCAVSPAISSRAPSTLA